VNILLLRWCILLKWRESLLGQEELPYPEALSISDDREYCIHGYLPGHKSQRRYQRSQVAKFQQRQNWVHKFQFHFIYIRQKEFTLKFIAANNPKPAPGNLDGRISTPRCLMV
jgi:hypothetical protein